MDFFSLACQHCVHILARTAACTLQIDFTGLINGNYGRIRVSQNKESASKRNHEILKNRETCSLTYLRAADFGVLFLLYIKLSSPEKAQELRF